MMMNSRMVESNERETSNDNTNALILDDYLLRRRVNHGKFESIHSRPISSKLDATNDVTNSKAESSSTNND